MAEFFLRLQGNTIDELPKAPSDLVLSNIANRELVVSWTNNDLTIGESNIVQLWNPITLRWMNMATLALSASTYNLYDLLPNTDYKVRVSVLFNESYFPSLTTEFTTTNIAEPTPSNVQASGVNHEQATITWENNPILGVGECNEVRLYEGTTLIETVTDLDLSATTHTFTGLTQGTAYSAQVCVKDEIVAPPPVNTFYYCAALTADFTTDSIIPTGFDVSLISYDGIDYRVTWTNHDPTGETTWHKYVWMTQNYVDYTYTEIALTGTTLYQWNNLSEGPVQFGLVTVDGEIPTGSTTYYSGDSIYEVQTAEYTVVAAKTFDLDTAVLDYATLFTPTGGSLVRGIAQQKTYNRFWIVTGPTAEAHNGHATSGITVLSSNGIWYASIPVTRVGNASYKIFPLNNGTKDLLFIPDGDDIRSFAGVAVQGAFKVKGDTRTVVTGYTGGFYWRPGQYTVCHVDASYRTYVNPSGGGDESKKLIRYDANGVLDTGFTTITSDDNIRHVTTDGTYVYVAGRGIKRYLLTDGSEDMAYSTPAPPNTKYMLILSDGKLLYINDSSIGLLNTDGTLVDPDPFSGKLSEVNNLYALLLQTDGKIIIVGSFKYEENPVVGFCRINDDYTYDSSTFQGEKYTFNFEGGANGLYVGTSNKLYGFVQDILYHGGSETGYYDLAFYKII